MPKTYRWEKMPLDELLDMRICDLKLTLKNSRVEHLTQKLLHELKRKKLLFRPHFWISDEWFTPDGIPGIAIPFYLIHPRLLRLEQKMVVEAEGSTSTWCMKLLRHEAGHAIDNAFGLRRIKRRQQLFGLSGTKYPDSYAPKPYSKNYVAHLDSWYAQAHPDEDWAESFAVWLAPHSGWKKKYAKWPAIKKLNMVNEIMEEIQNTKPKIKNKYVVRPCDEITQTLKSYYKEKRKKVGMDQPIFFSADLYKIFSASPEDKRNIKASRFIRSYRKEICVQVARWTGQYQYNVSQMLDEIIDYVETHDMRLKENIKKTKLDFINMLTAQSMNFLMSGQHRIVM